MANGDKAQVMIELQLEMKKLKGQLKDVLKEFKGFKKELESLCKTQAKCMDEQIDALKQVESAQAKLAKNWTKGEKEKAKASKAATDQVKNQEKELGRLGRVMEKIKKSGVGKFAGGFAAGAGMSRGKEGTAQSMGGSIGRGISRGAGGALGFFTSGVTQAYQTYMQYGAAQAGLAGLGRPSNMRGGLKAAGGVGGANLGYGPTETVQQARGIGRATGNIGSVYKAQQFARSYGMDVGEAGGYMGTLRQAGFGFGGETRGAGGKMTAGKREGSRELTKIIEAGMISGLEKGRIGEFLQGVSSITSSLGSQLPGKINVSGIAAQAATLGQSKMPGFQGARGMQLMARLNQSIQKPGGGEAGQSMMMQALGFGKPGGGTRYYDALKMQEEGINNPRNLPKMFKEVYSQLGDSSKGGRAMGNEEANLAMREMTGLSLKTVEELQDIMASGDMSAKSQERIKELMEKSAPIEEQAMKESRKGFLGVAKHIAGVEAKQIAIGAQFAPMFMKMQNYQLELLKIMADYVPEIVRWLKEVYSTIHSAWQVLVFKIHGEDKAKLDRIEARHRKEMKEMGVTEEATTMKERVKIFKDRRTKRMNEISDIEKSKHQTDLEIHKSTTGWNILDPTAEPMGAARTAQSTMQHMGAVLRKRNEQRVENIKMANLQNKMAKVQRAFPDMSDEAAFRAVTGHKERAGSAASIKAASNVPTTQAFADKIRADAAAYQARQARGGRKPGKKTQTVNVAASNPHGK